MRLFVKEKFSNFSKVWIDVSSQDGSGFLFLWETIRVNFDTKYNQNFHNCVPLLDQNTSLFFEPRTGRRFGTFPVCFFV